MSSGVQPSPDCLEKYQELKSGRKYTYIIYGISDDKKNIIVLETSTDKDFDAFTSKLPEKDCRWIVYDFEFDLGADGVRNKLAFIMWTPDEAGVRSKMLFASSKDALRRRLDGIAIELQATDFSEITHAALLDKATRR